MERSLSFIQRVMLILVAGAVTWLLMRSIPPSLLDPDPESRDPVSDRDLAAFKKRFPKVELDGPRERLAASELFLGQPKKAGQGFDAVIGLDDTKKLLKALLTSSAAEDCPNGVILHGPPGTGKTMLAKAVAQDLGDVPMFLLDPTTIEDKYVGESGRRLRALFSVARKCQPSVIFIDELDGFASTRSALDASHVTTLKTVLLTLLDGMATGDEKVTVIAATNRLSAVDPAVRRRLRLWVEVPPPTEEALKEILVRAGAPAQAASDIAPECHAAGLTGSDARQLCALARIEAAATDTIMSTELLRAGMGRLHGSTGIPNPRK
jgi:SpoVK/Ycf46/Vps4 family AAA+-type ATPase